MTGRARVYIGGKFVGFANNPPRVIDPVPDTSAGNVSVLVDGLRQIVALDKGGIDGRIAERVLREYGDADQQPAAAVGLPEVSVEDAMLADARLRELHRIRVREEHVRIHGW